MPDRYALMVLGCKPLFVWHQTTNALHVSTDRGQGKVWQEAASKQANVFMAEEYFPQVDLATELFRMPWNASGETPAAE